MNKELHRHDISDSAWEKIKPHTIGEKGTRGGNAKNTDNGKMSIADFAAGETKKFGSWHKIACTKRENVV